MYEKENPEKSAHASPSTAQVRIGLRRGDRDVSGKSIRKDYVHVGKVKDTS